MTIKYEQVRLNAVNTSLIDTILELHFQLLPARIHEASVQFYCMLCLCHVMNTFIRQRRQKHKHTETIQNI